MAKRSGQKLKLLYLMKILLEQTDEDHGLTIAQLAQKLEEWGVSAERKSLYDDLETLQVYGLDVISPQGRGSYGVGSRLFEVAELKLLVDAVQSSRFITAKKSRELIGKVESLASVYHAQTLQRQVYVANRIKTMNESIYYNIDALHQAIAQSKQISFRYFQWAVGEAGEDTVARRFRREGERYQISPWALTWDDENYYLVAYDTPEQKIKHFRVDKMEGIRLEQEKRDGAEQFQKFDMAVYSCQVFGMYGGEEAQVRLRFANHLAGVVVDRFGKDVPIRRDGEDHFTVWLSVAVSPQFFSWVLGFGEEAQILEPQWVLKRLKSHLEKTLALYE